MWRHVPVVASGRASTRVNVTKPVGLLSPAAASQPPDSVIVQNISIFSVVTGQPQPSPAQPSPAQHIYTECRDPFIAPTLAVLLRCCPATETNVDILLSA